MMVSSEKRVQNGSIEQRKPVEQPSAAFLRVVRGAWFKELREQTGLQQQEVADLLSVASHRPISSLENGGTSLGSRHYPTLASIYEQDPEDFGRKLLAVTDPTLYAMVFPNQQETVAGYQIPVISSKSKRRAE